MHPIIRASLDPELNGIRHIRADQEFLEDMSIMLGSGTAGGADEGRLATGKPRMSYVL
jgi:hypothetical protein